MKLKLFNRADGVNGHYCIGRIRPKFGMESSDTWEFWFKEGSKDIDGKFVSAGSVFVGEKRARSVLRKLEKAGNDNG